MSDPDYQTYENRLSSFKNWPENFPIKPDELALHGFYHLAEEENIKCAWCNVVVSKWDEGLPASAKHNRHCRNKSFTEGGSNMSDNQQSQVDDFMNFCPSSVESWKQSRQTVIENYTPYRNRYNNNSDHDYDSYRNRLASFHTWSENYPVFPKDLAAAGLYYTGPADRVQCVYCGGGLLEWEIGDVPILEHQRHFPQCPFIRSTFANLINGPYIFNEDDKDKSLQELKSLEYKSDSTGSESDSDSDDSLSSLNNDIVDKYMQTATAVNIARELGYTDLLINQALHYMINHRAMSVESPPTAPALLDAIFALENENEDTDNDASGVAAIQLARGYGFSDEDIETAVKKIQDKGKKVTFDRMMNVLQRMK